LDRAAARKLVARLLDATADPDGRGLLVRGLEFQPLGRADVEPHLLESLLRLGRLAESAADTLRVHPDAAVRRSAASVAARLHPLRAAFDG
jgi:hypothetical protein